MEQNWAFSAKSVARLASDHGKRLISSLDVGWSSLLVETRRKPASVEL
jgi:hypothetical protein